MQLCDFKLVDGVPKSSLFSISASLARNFRKHDGLSFVFKSWSTNSFRDLTTAFHTHREFSLVAKWGLLLCK